METKQPYSVRINTKSPTAIVYGVDSFETGIFDVVLNLAGEPKMESMEWRNGNVCPLWKLEYILSKKYGSKALGKKHAVEEWAFVEGIALDAYREELKAIQQDQAWEEQRQYMEKQTQEWWAQQDADEQWISEQTRH